jgi:DNA-binding response OmpR family regulator
MRVLIAEHHEKTAHRMQRTLTSNCMAVDMAPDIQTAEFMLSSTEYDVLVLERGLPPLPGEGSCGSLIRGAPEVRTLMISGSGSSKDKVEGLVLGADDYLAKPFHHDELLARVRALGRRPAVRIPPTLAFDDLRFDLFTQEVTRRGLPIDLTLKERAVLETIMGADGGIVSSEELLEKAWDRHANPFSQVVKVTICALRRKLGGPSLIDNVRGQGYRLKGEVDNMIEGGLRDVV